MKFLLLLIPLFISIPSFAISESAPSEGQLVLLGEEFNTMRQMRYRLKELLEQQEFANKLNQAGDGLESRACQRYESRIAIIVRVARIS